MNTGGWLLLTVIFGLLLLVVQRTERKRRNASFVIMLIAFGLAWRYAAYRMERDCGYLYPVVCTMRWYVQRNSVVSSITILAAIVSAIIFNILFWVMFGRSNPPGSSDDIKVLGMND